jgi:clan AA aspartic protease
MAQEIGQVNDDLEPLIRLQFLTGATIECLVDTGFNGGLMLPEEFVQESNLPFVGEQTFRVAGQRELYLARTALAGIVWLGDEFDIEVAVSETGFALIGAELMIDCRLEIDYTASTIVIEKVV